MTETDWFEGRTTEDRHERCYWRRVGLVIFFALAVALILGPLLASCATAPEEEIVAKVCYMRPMGRTEEGYAVVMQACQSPESFKASQQ